MGKKKKARKSTAQLPNKFKHDWKHEIKVSQDYICPVCKQKGTDYSMDIHHCKNKCKGGNNSKANCVAVHKTCHRLIHKEYGNKYYDPREYC